MDQQHSDTLRPLMFVSFLPVSKQFQAGSTQFTMFASCASAGTTFCIRNCPVTNCSPLDATPEPNKSQQVTQRKATSVNSRNQCLSSGCRSIKLIADFEYVSSCITMSPSGKTYRGLAQLPLVITPHFPSGLELREQPHSRSGSEHSENVLKVHSQQSATVHEECL